MVLALAGMALLYAAFVGVAASWATAELGSGGIAVVAVVAALLLGAQYRSALSAALKALDAERVDRSEYPDLHARVDRLANQAGVPAPDVAVAPHSGPNASRPPAAGTARSSPSPTGSWRPSTATNSTRCWHTNLPTSNTGTRSSCRLSPSS
jgi:Zn-dependent protease with chaperone function